MHASPPCKEYSRLKLRPGGPRAIRSPESSRALLERCVQLLECAFEGGGHGDLEQPTNAMSWLEDFLFKPSCYVCTHIASPRPLASGAQTLLKAGCLLRPRRSSLVWQASVGVLRGLTPLLPKFSTPLVASRLSRPRFILKPCARPICIRLLKPTVFSASLHGPADSCFCPGRHRLQAQGGPAYSHTRRRRDS